MRALARPPAASRTMVSIKKKSAGLDCISNTRLPCSGRFSQDEVCADVKKQRDLRYDLDMQISYIYGQLGDNMDEKLSRWNLAKLQQQLKPKSKNSTGVNALEMTTERPSKPSAPEVPSPPVPDAAAFQANFEKMVNAAVSRERGRQPTRTPPGSRAGSSESRRLGSRRVPNPRFEGCWCCRKKGHSRRDWHISMPLPKG